MWNGPGPTSQATILPWTLVEDAASAADFAAGLAEAPIGRFRGTSISGALTFAASLFQANGYEGLRRAIDVSGDGAEQCRRARGAGARRRGRGWDRDQRPADHARVRRWRRPSAHPISPPTIATA